MTKASQEQPPPESRETAPADTGPNPEDANQMQRMGAEAADAQIEERGTWQKIKDLKSQIEGVFEADDKWQYKGHGIITEPAKWTVRSVARSTKWTVRNMVSPTNWLIAASFLAKSFFNPIKWFLKASFWGLEQVEKGDQPGSIKQLREEYNKFHEKIVPPEKKEESKK